MTPINLAEQLRHRDQDVSEPVDITSRLNNMLVAAANRPRSADVFVGRHHSLSGTSESEQEERLTSVAADGGVGPTRQYDVDDDVESMYSELASRVDVDSLKRHSLSANSGRSV